MLNRWKRILLMMVLVTVYGCDGIFYNRDEALYDRDPMYLKLLNMEINQTTKVDTLIDGEWEYVCVLTPYQEGVWGLENKTQAMKINAYIKENNIPTEDGHWHLVFSNSENLNLITFTRKYSDAMQRNFDNFNKGINFNSNIDIIKIFNVKNFSPKDCVIFHEAVFFKFIQGDNLNEDFHNKIYYFYLTLGELKNE